MPPIKAETAFECVQDVPPLRGRKGCRGAG